MALVAISICSTVMKNRNTDYSHAPELDGADGGVALGSVSFSGATGKIAGSAACATDSAGAKVGSATTKDVVSPSSQSASFVDFGVLTSTFSLIIYILKKYHHSLIINRCY